MLNFGGETKMKLNLKSIFIILSGCIYLNFATEQEQSCIDAVIAKTKNADLKRFYENMDSHLSIFYLRSIINTFDRYQSSCQELLRHSNKFTRDFLREADHCFDEVIKEKVSTKLKVRASFVQFLCSFNVEEKQSKNINIYNNNQIFKFLNKFYFLVYSKSKIFKCVEKSREFLDPCVQNSTIKQNFSSDYCKYVRKYFQLLLNRYTK